MSKCQVCGNPPMDWCINPNCPSRTSPPIPEPAGETNAGTFVCSKCGNSSAWDERGNWNVFEGQGKCSDPCPYLLATNAAPIGGKLPSMGVQHPDGAAPLSDLRGRLEAATTVLELERAASLVWLNQMRERGFGEGNIVESLRQYVFRAAAALEQAERRVEELRELLRRVIEDEGEANWSLGTDLVGHIKAAIRKDAGL